MTKFKFCFLFFITIVDFVEGWRTEAANGTKKLISKDWETAENLLMSSLNETKKWTVSAAELSVLHNNLGLAVFLNSAHSASLRTEIVKHHFNLALQYADQSISEGLDMEVPSLDSLHKNRAWLSQTLNDRLTMDKEQTSVYTLVEARRSEPLHLDNFINAISIYDVDLGALICSGASTSTGSTSEFDTGIAYLDLVKRAVTNFLYEVLPHPMMPVADWDIFYRQRDFQHGGALPSCQGEGETVNFSTGITTVPKAALDFTQFAIEQVVANNIPGDLIEAGVWRGGLAIFMRATLKVLATQHSPSSPFTNICRNGCNSARTKQVWAADSFSGIPFAENDELVNEWKERYAVDLDTVQDNFHRFGLLDDGITFLKGHFNESLPQAPQVLSLIHADADSFDSTMDILENLYPRLAVGGYIIIDDFHLDGAREAVIKYRAKRGITEALLPIAQDYVMTCRKGRGTVLKDGTIMEGARSSYWRRSYLKKEQIKDVPNISSVVSSVWQMSRPWSSLIKAGTTCGASGILLGMDQFVSNAPTIAALSTAMFFHGLGVYALDDYWDREPDRTNHPERPLPSGSILPSQARNAGVGLFAASTAAAAYTGSPEALAFMTLNNAAFAFYTPLCRKSKIVANGSIMYWNVMPWIVVPATFGMVSTVGTVDIMLPALFMLPATYVRETVFDWKDVNGDREAGLRTVATIYGKDTVFKGASVALGTWGASVAILGANVASGCALFPAVGLAANSLFLGWNALHIGTFSYYLRKYCLSDTKEDYKKWRTVATSLKSINVAAVITAFCSTL
eukprot:g1691.t1